MRPVRAKMPANISWNGLKLSVYFWREEDAGYMFDSEVQGEVFSREGASLKISHGDSLFRTQKRKSVRVKIHKAANLYLLDGNGHSDSIERKPGITCYLEDLSDTGCSALIGGKFAAGLRVKIQFVLTNIPVYFSGTIRSAEYREEVDRSLLHIEADPMTCEMRNHVLGKVFGMLPDEPDEGEEALPFTIPNGDGEKPPESGAGSETEKKDENSNGDQSDMPDDAV
jgi:hypothetical protein